MTRKEFLKRGAFVMTALGSGGVPRAKAELTGLQTQASAVEFRPLAITMCSSGTGG